VKLEGRISAADDDYDYADAYDFTPAASGFVAFRNQCLPYQLVP